MTVGSLVALPLGVSVAEAVRVALLVVVAVARADCVGVADARAAG